MKLTCAFWRGDIRQQRTATHCLATWINCSVKYTNIYHESKFCKKPNIRKSNGSYFITVYFSFAWNIFSCSNFRRKADFKLHHFLSPRQEIKFSKKLWNSFKSGERDLGTK